MFAQECLVSRLSIGFSTLHIEANISREIECPTYTGTPAKTAEGKKAAKPSQRGQKQGVHLLEVPSGACGTANPQR